RALVVDVDRALVPVERERIGEPRDLDVEEVDEREVFLVADVALVDDVDVDVELGRERAVRERGRDRVRVRVVLERDDVRLAAVRAQERREGARALIVAQVQPRRQHVRGAFTLRLRHILPSRPARHPQSAAWSGTWPSSGLVSSPGSTDGLPISSRNSVRSTTSFSSRRRASSSRISRSSSRIAAARSCASPINRRTSSSMTRDVASLTPGCDSARRGSRGSTYGTVRRDERWTGPSASDIPNSVTIRRAMSLARSRSFPAPV